MTVRELYEKIKTELAGGGVENAGFEAEQLLRASGIDKLTLITEPGHLISGNISAEISARVERRLRGEPLQYLVGEWEFYGLPFKVGEGVLIPRQDTETLVELALDFLRKRDINARRTVDLCSGTGCIGITLAKLADANVLCNEMYYAAEYYLLQNIKLNGVEVSISMENACSEDIPYNGFDLVVCNPPYLTSEDMRDLQREVKFEPESALFGGEDGLDFYRKLIPIYAPRLYKGGMLAVEIGKGQEEAVCELFRKSGLNPQTKPDANGIIRVVYAIRG